MFSVRGKSGKIMAAAVVGMAEFRTDHGMPAWNPERAINPRSPELIIRRDPWEIPPPVFCQPAEEIVVANGVTS